MRGYIRKRGKSYRVEIHIGYGPDGKRLRHMKTLSTRKAAEKYLRTKLDELETEGGIRRRNLETLEAYLKRWLQAAAKPRLRQRTFEDYQETLRRHIFDSQLGRKALTAVTPSDIQVFYGELLARIQKEGRGSGVSSVKKLHAVLRNALGQAVKWRDLPQNPAIYVDLPREQKKRDKPILASSDFPAFIQAALQEDRLGVMWVLALATGARPEEYLALKWPDFSDNLRQVTIQRALIRPRKVDPGQPLWWFEEPKTAQSRRTLILETEVTGLLKQHRAQQAEEKLAAGEAYEDHGLVFCNELGGPLHQTNLSQRVFKRVVRRAGLSEELTPYSLRHSAATSLLKDREALKIVADMLGHAGIRLAADTYSHVTPDMLEEAAGKLAKRMFGG